MRVFVLCTGRCGSTTLTYACKHITNFTAGHETRAKFIGSKRLQYPDNHIEIDNRLSWFLGRLAETYADGAYYVHLTRDPVEVAKSYARKMNNPTSIGAAHKRSILMNTPQADLDVCLDVVHTIRANIEAFLRDKSHVMRMSLEAIEEDFSRFWDWIGAEGDKEAAISEWRTLYNDSKTAHGAIRPPMPKTELADLREKYKSVRAKFKEQADEIRAATDMYEHAEQLHREVSARLGLAEQRCSELATERVRLVTAWEKERSQLKENLLERERAIANLQRANRSLEVAYGQVAGRARAATDERNALIEYADELERRFLNVLRSRTWRVFGPYRLAMRKVKEHLKGEPISPNSLPERPPDKVADKSKSRFRKHPNAVPQVRRLDKRLWAGFSRPALQELISFRNDNHQVPQERAEAAYSLARWYSVQGDMERALEEIRNMRSLDPGTIGDPRQYLPEALFLCRLGRADEARARLSSARGGFHPTTHLIYANTWNPEVAGVAAPEAEERVLRSLNTIYQHYKISEVRKRDAEKPLSIDNLQGNDADKGHFDRERTVTVIVPVFNAEETILTALTGLAEQTWQNLEVLIVDDASTDRSADIVSDFCTQDRRFRLLRQKENCGSYRCRNLALKHASGKFVTVHDSDDWSHPEKIRIQVNELINRPAPYNLAMWVRTTSALSFFGNSRTLHDLVRPDHSSGLFPRETLQRFGAWDAVRISADTELYWRIESLLGNKKWMFNRRQVMKGCPLSFGRMSNASLTQTGVTSVMTIYHGVRREYRDAVDFWHSKVKGVHEDEPWTRKEPFFQVPKIMDPSNSSVNSLSALLVADWNCTDSMRETIMQVVRLCEAGRSSRLGLFHYPRYYSDVSAPLDWKVRGFAWDNGIRVVAPGEVVDADVVLILSASSFEHRMDRFPEVSYRRLVVVDPASPATIGELGGSTGCLEKVREHLLEYFNDHGECVKSLSECIGILEAQLQPCASTSTHLQAQAIKEA